MPTSEFAVSCLAGVAATVAVHAEVAVSALPPLPDAHGFAGSFAGLSGRHLMVAGGANFPDGVMPWNGGKKVWHDSVFALDTAQPESGWVRLGGLPQAVGYGVSITVPEGLLIIGGGNATTHSAAVRLLERVTDRLVVTDWPALPVALANGCGARCGRWLHVAGGTTRADTVVASNRHFMLDLEDREKGWVEAPPLPGNGVMLATAIGHGEDFYVVGGCALHPDAAGKPVRTYLRQCWKFANQAWTRCPDPPRAAVGAASPGWVHGGSLVVAGGDDGSQTGAEPPSHRGFCRDLLAYDPAAAEWRHFAEVESPLPVTLPAVSVAGGYVLVSGEIRPGVRTPAVIKLAIGNP
jgi:N-acetylneuraminic acid mutarotase